MIRNTITKKKSIVIATTPQREPLVYLVAGADPGKFLTMSRPNPPYHTLKCMLTNTHRKET